MRFIPFPPTIARLSADRARAHQRRSGAPRSHLAVGAAVYAVPDGTLREAYDPYTPLHPEGAVPGIGDVRRTLRHHANDTSGYDSSVASFTTLEELERDGMRIDRTAAAIVVEHGESSLVVATDEDRMASYAAGLRPGATMARTTVTAHGEPEGDLDFFVAIGPSQRIEIHAARTLEALGEAVRVRFPFLSGAADPIAALEAHGAERNWDVVVSTREDASIDLSGGPRP